MIICFSATHCWETWHSKCRDEVTVRKWVWTWSYVWNSWRRPCSLLPVSTCCPSPSCTAERDTTERSWRPPHLVKIWRGTWWASCPFAMHLFFVKVSEKKYIPLVISMWILPLSDLAFVIIDLIWIRHIVCNLKHIVLQTWLMQLPYWAWSKAVKVNRKTFSDFSRPSICQVNIEASRLNL